MTGTQLVQFRKQNKRTQIEAARELGVSQTYLSMLEKGKRPLTDDLRAKAVWAFHLSPTEMPVSESLFDVRGFKRRAWDRSRDAWLSGIFAYKKIEAQASGCRSAFSSQG